MYRTIPNDQNICPKCSFPKDLCICESLGQEEQRVDIYTERRKWGREVTVVSFLGNIDINLNDFSKKAKKFCASGGTVKNNTIELQGDHRLKIKKFLIDNGFPEENIEIRNVAKKKYKKRY